MHDISFEAWVKDLESVVDTHGHERFALLGFTCAAGVAVEYAARHPERVSHLILFGGFATSYHSTSHPDPAVRREGDLLVELAAVGWGNSSPSFRQVFASRFMPDATPAQWNAFDRAQRQTATPDVAVRYLQAMYAMNVKDSCARVRCPTLVLHPKDDQMVRFEQGRRLAALIPGASFVALEGSNHIPFTHEAAWTGFIDKALALLECGARPAGRGRTARETAPADPAPARGAAARGQRPDRQADRAAAGTEPENRGDAREWRPRRAGLQDSRRGHASRRASGLALGPAGRRPTVGWR